MGAWQPSPPLRPAACLLAAALLPAASAVAAAADVACWLPQVPPLQVQVLAKAHDQGRHTHGGTVGQQVPVVVDDAGGHHACVVHGTGYLGTARHGAGDRGICTCGVQGTGMVHGAGHKTQVGSGK